MVGVQGISIFLLEMSAVAGSDDVLAAIWGMQCPNPGCDMVIGRKEISKCGPVKGALGAVYKH
jgi:hypothetical protein